MNTLALTFAVVALLAASAYPVVRAMKKRRAWKEAGPMAFKYEPVCSKHWARVQAERRVMRAHIRMLSVCIAIGAALSFGAILFVKLIVDLCMN
jgi:hypothetical protein